MGLNCGGKCGMFFLITINGIFLILGIALLIVGILLKVDSDVIDDEKIVSTLNEVQINNLKLGSLASSLPVILIVIGVIVLIISGLGVFGACCKNRCMLVVYAIIVLLLLILQIAAIALFAIMKSKVEDEVQGKLSNSLEKKYKGVSSTEEISKGWDLIFINFQCCGVKAVVPTAVSNDQEFYSGEADSFWARKTLSDKVPASCCVAATQENFATYTEDACTQLTDASKYRTKGCYQAIKDYILKYQAAAIGIGVALLIIELIGIIFAFVLCRAIGKSMDIV
ncbi:CD63 antigen-like [Mya arenaria]|uniref:CD63 antigen-like n=1 Tax=Mya arenaria TaxID=6604 RepID=UPI0022E20EC1|nr:CD63 antigen-like [Mya arenaria]XP_052805047.1 CD63 antigen-like [Mya arenaria]XP_052805048.1 CD63 antigen-like [Mya arenaria]